MARLERQQRVANVQRKAMVDAAENELRRQNAQLEKLRKDNAQYKEQLDLAEKEFTAQAKTGKMIATLRAREAGYLAEIEAEKERSSEIDKELADMMQEVSEENEILGQTQLVVRDPSSYARQIATLENRVEHALNAYDNQLTANAKLRQQIEHLKKERHVFGGLKKKLTAELLEQKKKMGEIIDRSNQAYEARDDAQTRMLALRERSDKELQESTIELKELNRVLEQEKKLKEFMGVKGRDRAKELEAAAKARHEKGEAKEKPEEVISQYEAVFEEIKKTAGIQETEALVDQFIETEDRNFSLFNLVNELNTNIEMLREQIHRVEQQISEYNNQSDGMDRDRKQTLKQLERKLTETESTATTLTEKAVEKKGELNKLVNRVGQLFDKIGCSREPIKMMLGDKDVTERNIMQFLGIIEQRANELLLRQAKLDFKAQKKWEADAEKLMLETDETGALLKEVDPTATLGAKPVVGGVLGKGPQAKPDGNLATVQLSATLGPDDVYDDDGEDDDDDDARPLTRSELRLKITKRSEKRTESEEASTQPEAN